MLLLLLIITSISCLAMLPLLLLRRRFDTPARASNPALGLCDTCQPQLPLGPWLF